MLAAFEAVGGREADFWAMTPRTYLRRMNAERDRLKREQDDRMELAWTIANLSRAQKIPKLQTLLQNKEKAAALTGEEITAQLRAMSAAMPKRSWGEWLEAQ